MKKIIALLLCAVVCLSFVACNNESGNTETPPSGENTENNGGTTNDTNNQGGETNNQGGENNENNLEKIDRGTVTTSENPLLPILFQTLADEGWSYIFNEDGTCGDQVYWWIENDTENGIGIKICTEYKWKCEIGAFRSGEGVYVSVYTPIYEDNNIIEWQPVDSYYVEYPNE